MKQLIACLLLGALFGVTLPMVSAQEELSPQHSAQEIGTLKQRVSELEKQLQTVENVEKLELQAKLAEANAKLVNAEFGKFARELKDSNDRWLRNWGIFFLAIISVIGVGVWSWLKSRTNQLIADAVENNLDGFKDAVAAQDTIKFQMGELAKAHAANVLWEINYGSVDDAFHSGEISVLSDETLLQLFEDEKFHLEIRCKAAKILANRESPRLVAPMLKFLNLAVDLESEDDFQSGRRYFERIANLCSYINTEEAYKGFAAFLNRILTDNLKHREALFSVFVTPTVYSVALTGFKLNLGDSISILRLAIPRLEIRHSDSTALNNLVRYFDIFNEPEGIKEMLDSHGTSLPPEVIDRCLGLLQKHDPEFVEIWRTQRRQDNAESS